MDKFFDDEPKENEPSHEFLNNIENLDFEEKDDDFDEEAFEALCLKFANSYMEKVFRITIGFYP
jgi:hypothetical protein